ncbi:MAG: efflux RND transporter permease subunit [Leptospira sp.]|nr:efflux RND transporter permease subunit [Leptospira sp.]
MKFANFILERRSLIFTIFAFFLMLGILEFIVMPREEDPRLKERFGVLKIIYPGASLENMKRFVTLPTEEVLAEIPSIRTLEIRIRPEVMIAEIRLQDSLGSEQEINDAWKRIEDAIKKAESKYPIGLQPWDLNRRVTEQEAILIALTGSDDILYLKHEIDTLRSRLLQIQNVAKINRLGDPEEEIEIFIPKQTLEEKGISIGFFSNWVSTANHSIPPGAMPLDGKKVIVKTDGWFNDIESISRLSIPLPGGELKSIGEIGEVHKLPKYPVAEIMRSRGLPAVGLGIVAKQNINLIQFGRDIEEEVNQWQKTNPNLKVEIINSQPKYVANRLSDLGWNLLTGIFIVALVLVSMMGFRIGILSAIIVPVIAIISLGIFGMFGGVLHQISIAAFVMALGLLIDNVIVILESVQEKIDSGLEIIASVKDTISSLAFPLLSATGTTLASFIPLLGSSGNSADFTRAIPIINMLTLSISFLFALFVTPLLGKAFLKPKVHIKETFYERVSERIGKSIPEYHKLILLVSTFLFLIAMAGFRFLPKKFFPDADRDQLILDLRMPEGTDINKTDEVAKEIESWLRNDNRLKSVIVFVGRSVPLFYYNLNQSPNSPHIAQFILNLKDIKDKDSFKQNFQNIIDEKLIYGNAILQELKQGPPVKAPIEVRLYSESKEDLFKSHQLLLKTIYQVPGLKDIRSDLGIGSPVLNWESDDASLSRYRASRSDVTLSILSQTRGIPIGYYRAGERPIPIIFRTLEKELISPNKISESPLLSTRTEILKLSSVSHLSLNWEPAILYRRNRETAINYYAEVNKELTADKATLIIRKKLELEKFPKSVRWEFGGEQAESGSANQSLIAVAPLGIMILISFLLLEFGSWKKTGIILLTVPLSMIGVVPGLFLSSQSFGFLSLLGIFALVGIVVNNGILILDYIGKATSRGEPIETAIQYSLSKRIRPILLTTLTTIAGLIPLAFTDATLWPPFAWTMIAGLLVSTFLTLFVIPAATYLAYVDKSKQQTKVNIFNLGNIRKLISFIFLGSLFSFAVLDVHADPLILNWKDIVKKAEESPRVKIAWEEWKRKNLEKEKFERAVYYPKLGLSVEHIDRNKTLFPNASIPVVAGVNPSYWTGGVELQQTLFDPSNWFAISKVLDYSEEAQRLLSYRAKETSQSEALISFVMIHRIKIKKNNLTELKQSLSIRFAELKRLYALGQVTESELFRIEQAINQAKISLEELEEKEKISILVLKRNLGIDDDINIGILPKEEELNIIIKEEDKPERLELMAIRNKLLALQEKKKSIEYEALPKLVAKGSYIYLNNNQFNTDNWAQLSLGVSMNPFDGGVRKIREEETESEIRTAKEEFNDLIRALTLEKEDSLTQVKVKKNEVQVRQMNVSKARLASRKEYERVKTGRSNINSWIDAEILFSEENDRFEMSKIDLLERMIRYRNVIGVRYDT